MTKAELLKKVSDLADMPIRDIDSVLIAFADVMTTEVHQKGDSVSIPGFGTFKQKKSEPRTARNPQTGGIVNVPAKTKVVFVPIPALRK